MGRVIRILGGGSGGSGTGWDGQVEFRADLPITLGTPAIGDIWLVESPTTFLGFTTYQSGLYIRDFNNGNLNDWRRLNVKVSFTDSEFTVVSTGDNSKKSKLDLSLISTSTTRTMTVQDKDGTIAFLSDIGLPALKTKSGLVLNGAFSGNPKKTAPIVFATPFPSANYAITLTAHTQNNTTFSIDYESRTATGFIINSHANFIGNLIDVTWIATEIGEN